tara:strand:- start:207 stop:671 length:465 start_codon:yes stop_codon:yes gene_type:complete
MIDYQFIPTTPEHVAEMTEVMRTEDAFELMDYAGATPAQALKTLRAGSRDTTSITADGKLVCIYGCVRKSPLSNVGCPWMLATPELPKHGRIFVRYVRAFLQEMLKDYDMFLNYGDASNKTSVRWMKWLGFWAFPPEPVGKTGHLYHRYEMRRN